ncbi:WXG100 family type VII secretion target [[Eubacterium] rectale]|jgi:WXG100 family type VII secretion target|uniref:ESAT-6-like protein n=5 Tax=Agathobacter rectalis TaxID=39491 RepID=A0AAW4WU97_9FIRM|nr:WXG100 family type VII secretion target [Agathobacter rectalis]
MKMASGQIRMTPDTMRERAGEYRTEAENVQSVIDKMDRLLETLLTEWEGSASEAYVNKFAELRPSFVKGKELIDDIAMALDKTAEAVESTDTQIANQFSM